MYETLKRYRPIRDREKTKRGGLEGEFQSTIPG